jgi:transposase
VKSAGGFDGAGATSVAAPLSPNERQELIELRRKFKQVQMERDILAKATAWFAGKSEKTSTSSTSS